jgi:hypothetical protein
MDGTVMAGSEANELWRFIDAGGVAGVLFLASLFLGMQVARLYNRNTELADRDAKRAEQFATTIADLRHAIDRLAERIHDRT